jgi:hypothetical protein
LQLLDEGKLKFGPIGNAVESVRNYTGITSEESRNKAEFLNTVDQYTNDILSLAKGPQTDGDARRARDLIRNNLNDPQIVRTQLEKLRGIFANSQDTAGTALNIQGKSLKGLDHVPVSLSQPLAERPKPGASIRPLPDGYTEASVLADAAEKIARGLSRSAVEAKLREFGIDPAKIRKP